jgi:exodeoxyribonuclease V alpha subunit
MERLKGTIVETIFRNNENGYTVALLETKNELLTITGVFGTDISGENIEVFGKRVHHPKYGEQFQVEREEFNNIY